MSVANQDWGWRRVGRGAWREIGGQGAKGFDSLEYVWKRRDLNMYVGQQRRWSKLKWQN